MKKLILIILALLVVALASVYLFIPGTLKVAIDTPIRANQYGVFRAISLEDTWSKWFPGNPSKFPASNNGYDFTLGKQSFNIQEVLIKNENNTSLSSQLEIVPVDEDSVIVVWQSSWEAGMNPVTRIQEYQKATKLLSTLKESLEHLRVFAENKSNLYKGYTIKEVKVKDTVLISTKFETIGYPSPEKLYEHIQQLKAYIKSQGATETDYPMLHYFDLGENKIESMIGIPISKTIPDTKQFFIKRLILGNILETSVTGGFNSVKDAYKQVELYVRDYKKTPPAIPFEMLITDRSLEKDSTKWQTKIYYPVF